MRDLLVPGIELMLTGMGVVFVFLILLVFITGFMSYLVNRLYRPEPVVPAVANASPTVPDDVSAETLAVIREAIRQHRDRQSRPS